MCKLVFERRQLLGEQAILCGHLCDHFLTFLSLSGADLKVIRHVDGMVIGEGGSRSLRCYQIEGSEREPVACKKSN